MAQLPPLMRPDGHGYMPLGCAAQWIATEGGAVDFDPHDEAVWQGAFGQLLGAIASEKVRVTGLRSGVRDLVPGFHFAGVVVDHPFAEATLDLILSETAYLRCYPYIDEHHWRKGFDDALVSQHKVHWTQLMVERGDVRELWPFTLLEAQRTGAPGRPSSIHLIEDELKARAIRGELASTLKAEADELLAWFRQAHPQDMRPTPKTIQNRIRARFRILKGPK